MAKRTIIVWDSREDRDYQKTANTELAQQLRNEKKERLEELTIYGKTNNKISTFYVNGKPATAYDWVDQTAAEDWIAYVQAQAANVESTIVQTIIIDSIG